MKILPILWLIVTFFAVIPKAYADCQPIYGGGSSCTGNEGELAVTKTVLNPSTNTFVHDMGVTDPRFSPSQTVTFHITVSNIGNETAPNVKVFDVLPEFVAASSPAVNVSGSPTIQFDAGNLAPGASQTFTVVATLDPDQSFPINMGITCMSNIAQAKDSLGHFGQSSSQFCVERKTETVPVTVVTPTPIPQVVQPVVSPATLPPTGADPLSYLALVPTGIVGILVRNLAEKIKQKK